MYEAYYHFQSSPFPAAPVASSYFPTQAIELARQSLVRSIERAEGPGLIIGPAGVGKSLLLRVLADHFAEIFRVALLSGTRINTRRSLLQNILFELGLPYRGLDEGELRLNLIDSLRPGDDCPNGILLLVDEAHTMPLRLLDELRMITNVVRDGQPRARLVLAGGPALEERFTNPKLDSFNQRIACRCYLQSLNREETYEFVKGQILAAGGNPDVLFPDDAIRAVVQATDGIPRLINQICDHALVMARANGLRQVTAALIEESWADLQQLPPPWQHAEAEQRASSSTVIEFGDLDSEADDAFENVPSADAEFTTGELTSTEGEHDLDEPTFDSLLEDVRQVQSAIVLGVPMSDSPVEWLDGADVECEPPPVSRAIDPFSDSFEEEVVVLDRDMAWEVEAFRGRPRVSCLEGRELVAELNAATARQLDEVDPASESIDAAELSGGFEITTMQFADPAATFEIPCSPNPDPSAGLGDSMDEACENEPCVSLPWAAPTDLTDDRDMIIIEDDSPRMSIVPVDERSDDAPRQVEYRQLFAQLRQASI